MENKNRRQNKGGCKPKINPKMNHYLFRLTDEENAKLSSFFDLLGMGLKQNLSLHYFSERK